MKVMGLHWYQEGLIWFVLLLALIETWARNNPVTLPLPRDEFLGLTANKYISFNLQTKSIWPDSLKLQQTQAMECLCRRIIVSPSLRKWCVVVLDQLCSPLLCCLYALGRGKHRQTLWVINTQPFPYGSKFNLNYHLLLQLLAALGPGTPSMEQRHCELWGTGNSVFWQFLGIVATSCKLEHSLPSRYKWYKPCLLHTWTTKCL